MASRSLPLLLHYLRRLDDGSGQGPQEDAQLLARFLSSRDEAAFRQILQRYGDMVWGLCVRQLGETADAEDAFQATFLVLVRKAASLRDPSLLGSWLYGVASRTALKLRGRRARQAAREQPLGPHLSAERPDTAGPALPTILDEEIHRLPAKYRVPVVLCYLQGLSSEEAARQLGCARGTVFSRLSRARDLLRRRLLRRGLDVSAGVLTAVLADNAALRAAPPLALRESTLRTSLLFALGRSNPALSVPLVTLAEEVIRGMVLSKMKWVLVVALTFGLAAGAGLLGHRMDAEQPTLRQGPRPEAGTQASKGGPPRAEVRSSGSRAGAAPLDMASRLKDWRARLSGTVDFKGTDGAATLAEILDALAKRHHLVFEVNDKAFKLENIADVKDLTLSPLPPMKASLERVLRATLARVPSPSGAGFLFRLDHVEITTNTFIQAELGRPTESVDPEDPDVQLLIAHPERALVWEVFEDAPIAQVLRHLADTYDLNLVTDPRVVKQLQTKATAQLNNVPVDTAVRLLLNMAGVSMVRLDNVLYLTTAENARQLRDEQAKARGHEERRK